MNERLEEAKAIVDKMQEEINIAKVIEMLKDNKIEFTHKTLEYRVRLLTIGEREELDILRKQKFGELLKDSNILFAKEIIKLYKEKGVDIEEIDDSIAKLQSQETDIAMQVGEAISKKENELVLKAYEEKINNILIEKKVLIAQKTMLLENCFENILEDFVYKCLAYLSLEKKQEENWVKAYNTFIDFNNETDSELIIKAAEYAMILQTV